MSVAPDTELRTATARFLVPSGGLTDDQERLTAMDDRTIVGVSIGMTNNQAVEVSFSSTAEVIEGNLFQTNDNRSPVVAVREASGGGEGMYRPAFELGISWDDGEELHIHTRNNTAANEEATLVVYYRER